MECIDKDRDTCEGAVVYGPEPYAQDVDGVEIMVWLCERHVHDRAMEI